MIEERHYWPVDWQQCQSAIKSAQAGHPLTLSPMPAQPGWLALLDRDGRKIGHFTNLHRVAREIAAGRLFLHGEVNQIDIDDDGNKANVLIVLGDEGDRYDAQIDTERSDILHLPPRYPDDVWARPAQQDACEDVFASMKFGRLTDEQASALLDYHSFARAIVQRHAPDLRFDDARPFAEAVAIYISRHREIAEGVVTMMRKRRQTGASHDGLERAITRFEFFEDVDAFCEDLEPG